MLVLWGLVGLPSHAAVIPFADNFNANTVGSVPTGWTTTGSTTGGANGSTTGSVSAQDLGAGQLVARHVISATRTGGTGGKAHIRSQAISFTNSPGSEGFDFTITAKVTVTQTSFASDDTLNFALVALASNGDFTDAGSSSRYQLQFNYQATSGSTTPQGRISLVENNGANPGTATVHASSTTTLTGTLNQTYTFTLAGTYAMPGNPASNLTLTGSLSDGTSTITVTHTDTATIRTGGFFGMRTGINNASNGTGGDTASATIHFDDYAIIPAPASLLCVGVLLAVVSARRQPRRQAS